MKAGSLRKDCLAAFLVRWGVRTVGLAEDLVRTAAPPRLAASDPQRRDRRRRRRKREPLPDSRQTHRKIKRTEK